MADWILQRIVTITLMYEQHPQMGRTFVNHVILNLTDTFSSTANLNVEETDQVVINIGDLTQSANFAGSGGNLFDWCRT